MTRRLSSWLTRPLIPILSLVFVVEAFAHEPVEPYSSPAIRVSATATIRSKPDQVQIDLGVVTEAQTAQAAATRNAQQIESVLTKLRETLGEEARIETSGYSLNPTYHAPKEGEPPAIASSTAVNSLRVTLNDLPQLGPVIDLALRAGANRIDRLQFTLKDEQAVQLRALRDAAVKAQAQADTLSPRRLVWQRGRMYYRPSRSSCSSAIPDTHTSCTPCGFFCAEGKRARKEKANL